MAGVRSDSEHDGNGEPGLLNLDAPRWVLWLIGTLFGMATMSAFLIWGAGGVTNLIDAVAAYCF